MTTEGKGTEDDKRKKAGAPCWETDRYRLIETRFSMSEPPELLPSERIVSMAAHPMGLLYLIEKGAPGG